MLANVQLIQMVVILFLSLALFARLMAVGMMTICGLRSSQ